MAQRSVLRITKASFVSPVNPRSSTNGALQEISELQKSDNLTLSVAHQDEDVRKVRALLMGPADTCYEFGMFEVHMKSSSDLSKV